MRTASIKVRGAVRRGEAFLDQEHPGWEKRINQATLAMAFNQDCLLGQLHTTGWYGYLVQREKATGWSHEEALDWSTHLGFSLRCRSDTSIKALLEKYSRLTKEWLVVIQEKLAKSGLQR